MTIHDSILPVIITVLGLYAGLDILFNIKKISQDSVLKLYFCVLGLMYLYIAVIYVLILLGIVVAIPATQASIMMRPVNILAIVTPFLIAKRLGL